MKNEMNPLSIAAEALIVGLDDAEAWQEAFNHIKRNKFEDLKKWLKNPAHQKYLTMHDDGDSLLKVAVDYARPGMVELLIDSGSDINLADPVYQRTALHHAISFEDGAYEVLKYLIDRGSNLDLKCKDGRSALDFALEIVDEYPDPLHLIVKAGADLMVQDEEGYNCLHSAIIKGNLEALKLFIAYGADVNAKISSGLSLIDYISKKELEDGFEDAYFAVKAQEMIRSKQEQIALMETTQPLQKNHSTLSGGRI